MATYISDDEAGFINTCKGYLEDLPAFDVIYDRIEVLDETSIIVAVPGKTEALELLYQRIADQFNDTLDQWTKRGAWYPHTTLYYDPELPAEMEYDFPRPPFYNKVFSLWGMEEGEEW